MAWVDSNVIYDFYYNKATIANVYSVFIFHSSFFCFYLSHMCGCPINSKKNKNQCKKTSNLATCPIMLGAINLTFSALYCSGNIYPLPFLLCFFLSNIYFNPPLSSTPPPTPVINISNYLVLVLGPIIAING